MRVRLLTYVVLLVLLSISVQSFGISFPYLDNGTIKLYPGQNYLFKLTVQNKDPEDMTVEIKVESSVATLVGGSQLEVPGETYDRYVLFNITLPENAKAGDEYAVSYVVSPVGKGEGQIPLAVSYSRDFKVLVVEKPRQLEEQLTGRAVNPPEAKPLFPIFIVLPVIILVILAVSIFLWKKSHQMGERMTLRQPEHQAQPLKPLSSLTPPQPPQSPPPAQQKALASRIEIINQLNSMKKTPTTELPKPAPARVEKILPVIEKKPIQKAQPLPQQEIHPILEPKQEKTISPHHYFHLRNGQSLKNLRELLVALKDMPNDEFTHHVNEHKNDFANWTDHVFEKQELANNMREKFTKQEIMELIKNELEKP